MSFLLTFHLTWPGIPPTHWALAHFIIPKTLKNATACSLSQSWLVVFQVLCNLWVLLCTSRCLCIFHQVYRIRNWSGRRFFRHQGTQRLSPEFFEHLPASLSLSCSPLDGFRESCCLLELQFHVIWPAQVPNWLGSHESDFTPEPNLKWGIHLYFNILTNVIRGCSQNFYRY